MRFLRLYLLRAAALGLLALLSACNLQTIAPGTEGELLFDICQNALEQPTNKRAFQGYDGWFFFDLDLEEAYPLLGQADFIIELSTALKAQGVTLVAVPVSSRAIVRPDRLYLQDPQQVAFDLREAEAIYTGFISTLRQGGVVAVDVVATARAFDAASGQTFFRRDLHWTPEGAKVIFSETATQTRQALGDTLPTRTFEVVKRPEVAGHRGQFVNNWTARDCGYLLPPEPLGIYDVSPVSNQAQAEVVLSGSSFSIEPYSYDFLAAALSTDVLNVSVGSGGAVVALQRYLLEGAYTTHKPKVLVWEFPTYAPGIGEETQLELLEAVSN